MRYLASLLMIVVVAAVLLFSQGALAADTSQKACTPASQQAAICNAKPVTPTDILQVVISVIALIIGVISVFSLIYGGFIFITANGEPAKVTKGRLIITYALVGLAVTLLAGFLPIYVLSHL